MKEEDLFRILKESEKYPSENFTSNLMEKITMEKKPEYNIRFNVIVLVFISILLLVSVAVVPFPIIKLLNDNIRISPLVIQISLVFFILIGISQLIEVYRKFTLIKHD